MVQFIGGTSQFTQSLDQIKIDDEVLTWVVSAMGSASAESKKQREAQVMVPNQQRQRLEGRLDRMCLDKLDGIICDEEYVRLSKKFRSELTDVKFRVEGYRSNVKPHNAVSLCAKSY